MSGPIYFHDNARLAAEHLLDSPFGRRLAQVARIERSEDYGYLSVETDGTGLMLSTGEMVLLDILVSLAGGETTWFNLAQLDRLDDANWDRVIGALFIVRGRVMAATS